MLHYSIIFFIEAITMSEKQKLETFDQRNYQVAKSNDLIQKARYDLSVGELKTLSYMISLIKPDDKPGKMYSFQISDYCRVRGIDDASGKNYKAIKETLQSLRNHSYWMVDENGRETLYSWIEKPSIYKGKVSFRFDKDIEKMLIDIIGSGRYTQYELINLLAMKSSYSIRLYELIKSWHGIMTYHKNPAMQVNFDINLAELRKRIGCEKKYPQFKEFRRNCLEPAKKEINTYTDLKIDYIKMTKGRVVEGIHFIVKAKDPDERLKSYAAIDAQLEKKKH